jgi:predicted KAP-like P-loop ATPase
MSDVFISYSRKDSEFVRTLNNALEKSNRKAWVDWSGIAKGTDWAKEVEAGIESADTFVFVISPDSLVSKVCQHEINHAVRYNKQILPIVYQNFDIRFEKDNPAHKEIRLRNSIFFRETDNFEKSLQELIQSLTINEIIKLDRLAFRYKNDKSRLFGLDKEGNIWIVDFPKGVWEKHRSANSNVPLKEIAVQSDGNDSRLFGLDIEGRIWTLNFPEGVWEKYGPANSKISFKKLAVQSGEDSHLFALDIEGNIWAIRLNGEEWLQGWRPSTSGVPLETITIQSGYDPHLFALDREGNTWAIGLPGGEWWQNWPSTPGIPLQTITAQSGNDPHLFALDREGNTWAIGLPGGGWVQGWPSSPNVPLQTITAESKEDGNIYLFGLDEDRNIWFMDWHEGVWIKNRWNIKLNEEIKQITSKNYIGQKLQNDLAEGDDQLNIKIEIEALTNVLMLRELKPPLAVGILGGWGSGKSFALHLMKQRINEIRSKALTEKKAWGEDDQLFPYAGHIYQIEFDAWTYAKSNLWASLMQKVFFELNRQISLEEKLKTAGVDLLKGGQIWKALNNMNDEQRRQILKSNLTSDILTQLKDNESSKDYSSALWETFGKVRQKEIDKLEEGRTQLKEKENELRKKESIIEKNSKENVDKEISNISTKLLSDFPSKLIKNKLLELMGITKQQLESKLTDNNNSDLEKTKITLNELKFELEFWKSLKKTCKDNPKILLFFITSLILLIISPWLLTQLNNWLSTFPLGHFSDSVYRITRLFTTSPAFIFSVPFIEKVWKGWKKDQKKVQEFVNEYQNKIEELAQSRQTLVEVEIEKAKSQNVTNLAKLENEIKQQQAFVEQQQQRIGLTTAYKSLNDLINIRHQTDPYSEQLGLLQQVKSDIEELTNCLVIQDDDSPDIKAEKRKSFVRGPARVVLYIDDLDRCPPHKVVEVLEAVQLLVKTSLFIVVLAIDDRYISRALEDVYKGVLKRRGKPSGIDYLEKIIQIPYRMRSISPINLKSYLESQMTVEEEQSEASRTISTPKKSTSETPKINPPETEETNSLDVDNGKETDSPDRDNVKETDSPDGDNGKAENKPIPITPELPKIEPSPEQISEIIKFTRSEFNLLANCSKHVDLSPRTGKRLINLYKILKIVWSHYTEEPKEQTKQIAITFLALSGRYPDFTRYLFEEIDTKFEESSDSNEDNPILTWKLQKLLNKLKEQVSQNDHHNQREWRKFENDLRQMLKISPPQNDKAIEASSVKTSNDSFSLDRETFRLALSFCFVGDIGYDPDDYHLPQITNR